MSARYVKATQGNALRKHKTGVKSDSPQQITPHDSFNGDIYVISALKSDSLEQITSYGHF